MMNLLSLFTGNRKKNTLPPAMAPGSPSCRRPARFDALEERQRLLAHHVRLVARGMANGLCVFGHRGGLGKRGS